MATLYAAYQKECIGRHETPLQNSTLRYYLKLDKSIYFPKYDANQKEVDYKIRFDDGAKDCLRFVYDKLNISLFNDDGDIQVDETTDDELAKLDSNPKKGKLTNDLPFLKENNVT
jgi:hypothetical protein